MTYRPDIDGLRALAVLSVVFFHADVPGFGGGFVGVDVFFVISGYLITSLVAAEIGAGTFTFRGFYERRVRRIFPALIAVLVACWLTGVVVLMPPDFLEFGKSLVAASLSISNYFFWLQVGYFEGDTDFKPLLHTWSLAIEEQFYLLLPVVLVLCKRMLSAARNALLAALWLGSLYISVTFVEAHPGEAFYLLPSRTWELLAGSLLALAAPRLRAPRWLREPLALLGLAAIVAPIALYTKHTPFPGTAALPPALGAALLIAAGGMGQTWVSRLLALRPAVAIGLWSYSIYLWHWPLLAFLRHATEGEASRAALGVACALSIAFGWASWRWVERPFRRPHGAPRRVLGFGALAMSLPAVLGLVTVLWDGMPGRLVPTAQAYAAAYDSKRYAESYERRRCFIDYDQSISSYSGQRCATFPGGSTRTKVLVIGDSFAAHLMPGLNARAEALGLEVRQITASSCRPMMAESRRCQAVLKRMKKVLAYVKPDVLVVSGYWGPRFVDLGKREFVRRVKKTLSELKRRKVPIVLVGQTPTFRGIVPYTLAVRPWLWPIDPIVMKSEDHRKVNATLRELSKQSVVFVDPSRTACDGLDCPVASAGEPYHWDRGHLTRAGSTFYAQQVGEAILQARAKSITGREALMSNPAPETVAQPGQPLPTAGASGVSAQNNDAVRPSAKQPHAGPAKKHKRKRRKANSQH